MLLEEVERGQAEIGVGFDQQQRDVSFIFFKVFNLFPEILVRDDGVQNVDPVGGLER